MIRNTLKYVSYKDRKELAQDLKLIYTASSEDEAYNNLQELKDKWGKRKVSLENWESNWNNIQPFFKYGPQTRKIMYTTNAIESLNNCYKRLNKGRPSISNRSGIRKKPIFINSNNYWKMDQ